MNKKQIFVAIMYVLCGIGMAIPFIFNQLWFLGWIAYVPIIINEYIRKDDDKSPYKKAWGRGLLFFYPFGIATFWWIVELYPMDFVGFGPITAFFVVCLGVLGIPLLQSIFTSLNVVLLCFLKKRKAKQWLYPLSIAFLWVIQEWLQTLTWAGIPWGRLAVGQVSVVQNIQSASLFGSYFIAFVMMLVNGFLAFAIINLINIKNKRKALISFISAIVLFVSNFLFGCIALNVEHKYVNQFNAAVIQSNIGTYEKWANSESNVLNIHKKLMEDAAADGADLLLTAETAFPFHIQGNVESYLVEIAKDNDVDILVGCYTTGNRNSVRNSLVYLSNEDGVTDQVYNKQKLVPFGEYVPMKDFILSIFPFLGNINMLSDDVEAGTESTVIETEYGDFGALICFDSIYETVAMKSVENGAQIFTISTNDAWFNDSAATTQHNAQAILRAVEFGRYVVRAGNTGISSIITDKGEVLQSIDPLIEGYRVSEVKTANYRTMYSYIGNSIVAVAFLFLSISFVGLVTKKHQFVY